MSTRLEPWLATLGPILLLTLAYFLLVTTGLDDRITDSFFDFSSATWPHKRDFLHRVILHDGARWLLIVIGSTCALGFLAGNFRQSLRPHRRALLFVVLAMGLAAGTVGILKDLSPVPSAWDSTRYGGAVPHLAPWAHFPPGVKLGQCFPGAHSAGGFTLMAFYFVFRERDLVLAWFCLLGGLAFGTLLGISQVIRGAHFPSHNCASGIVVMLVLAALYWLPFRGRLRSPAAGT